MSSSNLKDLTGQRFGSLIIESRAENLFYRENRTSFWNCKCDCGNISIAEGGNLRSGRTKSCGCKMGNYSHGLAKTPEYNIWARMIQRCTNPKAPHYEYYGGRGIKVCKEWLESFENFYRDMGPRPSPQHSLDRIHANSGYFFENCRWATPQEQVETKRWPRKRGGVRKYPPRESRSKYHLG